MEKFTTFEEYSDAVGKEFKELEDQFNVQLKVITNKYKVSYVLKNNFKSISLMLAIDLNIAINEFVLKDS